MSYYVYGSGLSYYDYLQAKTFVGDLSDANRRVVVEISKQTREVVASHNALARRNIELQSRATTQLAAAVRSSADLLSADLEGISGGLQQLDANLTSVGGLLSHSVEGAAAGILEGMADGFGDLQDTVETTAERLSFVMQGGFDHLSEGLSQVASGLTELNVTFHWGFSEIIAEIGHMQDALSDLIRIAKTPVQTVAFNHFEIARDAFRQGLYRESLEEVSKAIYGDQASPGYKLEWRFHQLVGLLRLGFANGDLSLLDLPAAEESFVLAARYARADYPEDAAAAMLSAGWAAYSQGKMDVALSHTDAAIKLSQRRSAEALFQAAKIHAAEGRLQDSLVHLREILALDVQYALKAAGDGDFRCYDDDLRNFLDGVRQKEVNYLETQADNFLGEIEFWSAGSVEEPGDGELRELLYLRRVAPQLPLVDVCEANGRLATLMKALRSRATALRDAISTGDFLLACCEDLHGHCPQLAADPDVISVGDLVRGCHWARTDIPAYLAKTAVPSIERLRERIKSLNRLKDEAAAVLEFWNNQYPLSIVDPQLALLADFGRPIPQHPIAQSDADLTQRIRAVLASLIEKRDQLAKIERQGVVILEGIRSSGPWQTEPEALADTRLLEDFTEAKWPPANQSIDGMMRSAVDAIERLQARIGTGAEVSQALAANRSAAEDLLSKGAFWEQRAEGAERDPDWQTVKRFVGDAEQWSNLSLEQARRLVSDIQARIERLRHKIGSYRIMVTEDAPAVEVRAVDFERVRVLRILAPLYQRILKDKVQVPAIRDVIYSGFGERLADATFARFPEGPVALDETWGHLKHLDPKQGVLHENSSFVRLRHPFYLSGVLNDPFVRAVMGEAGTPEPVAAQQRDTREIDFVDFLSRLNGLAGRDLYWFPSIAQLQRACDMGAFDEATYVICSASYRDLPDRELQDYLLMVWRHPGTTRFRDKERMRFHTGVTDSAIVDKIVYKVNDHSWRLARRT